MKIEFSTVIIAIILILLLFSSGCASPTQTTVPQTTSTPQSQYDKNMETLKGIVEEYHQTHTYTLADWYVCAQMAQDVWDMVETQGITAKIGVGNVSERV